MNSDHSQKQRIEGAERIVKTAREMAEQNGVHITKIEWNYGREIIDRASHSLTIEAGGKKEEFEFDDDELIAFSGKSGVALTLGKLTTMILSLGQ